MLVLFFLSSGLFLGWSLGANDAANVFGTAVGSRMVRFGTAALICSLFVIVGAVIGGAGAARTLGQLGAVDALGGAFVTALAAALTILFMTRARLPVSTSQAIVGAIIGWNLHGGVLTDGATLTKIVGTWVICPVLSAGFAVLFYLLLVWITRHTPLHLLWEDILLRWALIVVGAFGAYSLGANNIANVMGVFVPVAPFRALHLPFGTAFTGAQQLFLLGGIAIAVGVYTYSKRVMMTVGSGLFRLTPQMALVVVLAQAMVLFLFSSQSLEHWLLSHGLPTVPLVPVSSSQAVIGAVAGLGLLKGGHGIRYRVLGEIAAGWITTPVIACLVAFVGLFVVQNVFSVQVNRQHVYEMTPAVIARVERLGLPTDGLDALVDTRYETQVALDGALHGATDLKRGQRRRVVVAAEVDHYVVAADVVRRQMRRGWYTPAQIAAVRRLVGQEFRHRWELLEKLEALTPDWRLLPDDPANRLVNAERTRQRRSLLTAFRTDPGGTPAEE